MNVELKNKFIFILAFLQQPMHTRIQKPSMYPLSLILPTPTTVALFTLLLQL